MRKLLMLAAMALAAMVFAGSSATTASAGWAIFEPPDGGSPYQQVCIEEVVLEDNVVTGGCRVDDFEGTFELYANTPYPTTIGTYDASFDLVVDAAGTGYAVNPVVQTPLGGWPRVACDEVDETVRPWPAQIRSPSNQYYDIELDLTLGVRAGGSTPGSGCSTQMFTTEIYNDTVNPTVLDQVVPSANIRNGHWESENPLWIEWVE